MAPATWEIEVSDPRLPDHVWNHLTLWFNSHGQCKTFLADVSPYHPEARAEAQGIAVKTQNPRVLMQSIRARGLQQMPPTPGH